ncbi:MAG: translation initiation factor IF-2 [Candidatus Omnitrophica bacterium]|nr:translation initiation factor IF-2 [Candidatus Omnitrophota bacterium]
MKVAELAKELKTNSETILATLKHLKLKAKDSEQDLNVAVVSVIKSAFKKGDIPKVVAKPTTKKVAGAGKEKTADEVKVVKKVARKKAEDKEAKPEKKDVKKKVVKKKVVKKVIKKSVAVRKKSDDPAASAAAKAKTPKDSTGTADQAPATPAAPSAEALAKAKRKINQSPVITLKPLSRKRRKTSRDDRKDGGGTVQPIAEEQTSHLADAEQALDKLLDENMPEIEVKVPITVKDFATTIQQKPSMVLTQMMKMGMLAHINQSLGEEIVTKLTREFGFKLSKIRTQEEQLIEAHVLEEDDESELMSRAPVITFMGHVDHGKTSLLDRIRKSKIADQEHGGITQHMGAYSVEMPKGRITFLDTPGHEAFTAMRARGAHITDIVVLVVAADEGIMPQTEEAIDHARAANTPIVVALNKMDRPGANPDMVKKQLAELNLASEDWGGKTVVVGVSAKTGDGIDELLELILLESELLELKANPNKRASGIVVEAHLSQGKGVVSTLIVQSGTLGEGDFLIVGPQYGKVKALFDDHGRVIKEAGPSMPVEILGLSEVPEAGEMFYVVEDERQAKEISQSRYERIKTKRMQASSAISLDQLYAQIQEGAIKELNVVIKADVQGSLEALKDSLEKIPSDKVKVRFIHSGVGEINTSDVLLAVASKAIIIAFHVGTNPKAKEALEKDPVEVREYRIIYDAVNDIRAALEGMLEAKTKKNFFAKIEVRQVFKLTRGIVAGCYVTKGRVPRKAHVDLVRGEEIVYSGNIASLKRFKEDVKEVTEGMECGVQLENFVEYEAGDMLEVYHIEKISQKL